MQKPLFFRAKNLSVIHKGRDQTSGLLSVGIMKTLFEILLPLPGCLCGGGGGGNIDVRSKGC